MKDKAKAVSLLFILFIKAKSKKDYLKKVLRVIKKWIGSKHIGIRVIDTIGNIPYESYIGFDREFWEVENDINVNTSSCICTRVITGTQEAMDSPFMTTGGSFSCNDTDKLVHNLKGKDLSLLRGKCLEYGYKTLLVIPIKNKKGIVGVIHITDEETNKFDKSTVEFLEYIARFIAEAIQRFDLQEKLKKSEASLAKAQRIARLGNYEIDFSKNKIWWSQEVPNILGMRIKEAQPHKELFLQHIYPEDRALFIKKVKEALQTQRPVSLDHRVVGANGSIRFVHQDLEVVLNGEGEASLIFGTIQDITKQKETENRLHHLATHDYLTSIPNRYLLSERIAQAIEKGKKGIVSSLLFFDIDNFKQINDSLGHSVGDEIIVSVVKVIQGNLGEKDCIFRFGGDEFAILLDDMTNRDPYQEAEKLRKAIKEADYIDIPTKEVFDITISIGVVNLQGLENEHQVLILADNALYKAKQGGRNRVVLANPKENYILKLTETNKTVRLVRKALKEDAFTLYAQPIIDLKDNKVAYYELLLRLIDKNGSIKTPSSFIPIAERFGLMSQVDYWVIQRAMMLMSSFEEEQFFINLSGISMGNEALFKLIKEGLTEYQIDPQRICFEITETAAVKDFIKAKDWILKIKKLGCKFAVDDFGSGFSSFSYLRLLPVDYVKIDSSFIHNIHKNPTNYALAKAINEVSHTLNKKTIAEGVYDEKTIKMLKELGFNYGQGYYYGKPEEVNINKML